VAGDPEQPVDPRAAVRIESREPFERAGERLGRQVGAQLGIVRTPHEITEHRGRMPAIELRKRLCVRASGKEKGLVRDRVVDHP
jgi:hypothetical protein